MITRPPLPVCKAFLVCRDIAADPRTKEPVLIGLPRAFTYRIFPTGARMGFYARLASGHGEYQIEVQLQTSEGEVVWRDGLPQSIKIEPLRPHDVILKLQVAFPAPGQYHFVLLANGEEVAREPFGLHLSAQQVKRSPQ